MAKIMAADLFCGAGGTSTGLMEAAAMLGLTVNLVAVNHWSLAISTHSSNHPGVNHYNSDLQDVDPRAVVPGGYLRLLVASPECTHFSRARGGKPKSNQSRASVKYVLRWVRNLDVEDLLIENVPDFLTWGPLHSCTCGVGKHHDQEHASGCLFGLPVKEQKGFYFHRFIRALRRMGYQVDWRVLNAANYGDPQTRKRLFIIARKHQPIVWPEQTHHQLGGDMFGSMPRWRPARDIIDWSNKGESIFNRKTPLKPNTMRRIMAGLKKYGLRPFVLGQTGQVNPFIIQMDQGGILHDIDKPIPTITSADAWALVEPYIIPLNHGDDLRTHDINKPMPTITSVDAWGLIQPYLVEYHGDDGGKPRVRSVDEPLPTIDTSNRIGLAEPYLVEYHGTATCRSIHEPLGTLTGTDVFGLACPLMLEFDGKRYLLDILYRMLTPKELARGMSFPESYQFNGNREQVVKQIGNSVPVNLAKKLCASLLDHVH
jgi:DNA (cytosine-5)-methyltransferase 1